MLKNKGDIKQDFEKNDKVETLVVEYFNGTRNLDATISEFRKLNQFDIETENEIEDILSDSEADYLNAFPDIDDEGELDESEVDNALCKAVSEIRKIIKY